MKFRLPNVPPGARFWLKESVSTPYTWSSAVTAPRTAPRARTTSSGRASPSRARRRQLQKITRLDAVMATLRKARYQLVENSAERAERAKYAASTSSAPESRSRSTPRSARSPATSAVACRTSSLGTKKRSSSKVL